MGGERRDNTNALHYYVSKDAQAVVQRVYRELAQSERIDRSWVEIVDLEEFLRSLEEEASR